MPELLFDLIYNDELSIADKYPPTSLRSPDVISLDELIEAEDKISDIPW